MPFENRKQWFQLAESLGANVPGVQQILDGVSDDALQDMFVGDAPRPDAPTPVTLGTSDALQHSIAQELLNNQIGDASAFEKYGLIDSATGQLKSLEDDDVHLPDFQTAFTNYFGGINPSVKFGIEDYEDTYRDALPKPPAEPGK